MQLNELLKPLAIIIREFDDNTFSKNLTISTAFSLLNIIHTLQLKIGKYLFK